MKKNGILHVNEWAQKIGGAESYITTLCNELKEFDHYIAYECGADSNYLNNFKASTLVREANLNDLIQTWNIKTIIIHNYFGDFERFLKLRTSQNLNLVSVIHDYRSFTIGTGYNRVTRKRHRGSLDSYPLPITITRSAVSRKWKLDSTWKKKKLLHALSHFDKIIVSSTDAENLLKINKFPEEKIFKLPPGIKTSSPLTLDKIEGLILFVGSLTPNKCPDILLKALHNQTKNYQVVFLGDGPMRLKLEKLAQKLKINARFMGRVDSNARDALMRTSQFLVAPYILDSFGLTLIEAMAQETAVIAFDDGGPKDIVSDGQSGILCKSMDIDQLRSAIETLLSKPKLAENMGKEGRKRVEELFNLDEYIKKFKLLL